ncbi:hypothetical protein [Alterisphingorhabdus coralli]|uniref:Uncharacterized protein n=1 Tax=Alterisphingorhabdus coralli TaxID=3071408 RepID=A0AA97F772_9SPHN|nr:hypothetical protein [Parasphingorhabdus sp. SCSIO 66989]WOE74513.1 hypothetical protein RB602_11725 [Parasphingorhabdus sp. SCSIO 66989]
MNIGMIELIGVFGLVLAFLGWQYWSVSRDIAKDKEKKAQEDEDSS